MEVYFVRHGQTGGNVAKRHQAEITKLTKKGRQQAADIGIKLAELKPTHLLTSTHVRTLETAKQISDSVNLLPETSQIFTELHRPKSLYGQRHFGVKSFLYITRWYFGMVGGEVDSDEGESYESLRKRINAAKLHLETLPDDSRVIVVSHALFISLFLAHVCQEKPLSLLQAVKYWMRLTTMKIENGCGWELKND